MELDQTQEIFRLNALVGELETHQKVQAQRVDATAHRWKLKRDQVCVRARACVCVFVCRYMNKLMERQIEA